MIFIPQDIGTKRVDTTKFLNYASAVVSIEILCT